MATPINRLQLPDEGLMLARWSGKCLTRRARQCEGGKGAEHDAGQEGGPGAAAALREQDEDGGGDGDPAQRRRDGQG